MIARIVLNEPVSIWVSVIAPMIDTMTVMIINAAVRRLLLGKWSVPRKAASELAPIPTAINPPVVAPCAGVMPARSQ